MTEPAGAPPHARGRHCLVYLPHSYTGRGPAESCARLLEAFPDRGWLTTVHLVRARRRFTSGIGVREAVGGVFRHVPYRWLRRLAERRLERRFSQAIEQAPPGSIAWFWPHAPAHLVRQARAGGLATVREMINGPLAHAKPILDRAFADAGLPPSHGITASAVNRENDELRQYDYLFASNPEVEAALRSLGIDYQRILRSTFGWSRDRIAPADRRDPGERPFRACFLGTLNVRKGVPVLLEAWRRAGIDGELVLAGPVEDDLRPLVEADSAGGSGIVYAGPMTDVAALFRSCDVLMFPTLEEGGPQVTYEAAACGLPVITTPMGAARLVADGETGLVVPPGDPEALAAALVRMARDPVFRRSAGEAARAAAQAFEYRRVSEQRSALLSAIG